MRTDEKTPGNPEPQRLLDRDPRDAPVLDPDAPPAPTNEEHPAPEHPFKDQGDPLDGA